MQFAEPLWIIAGTAVSILYYMAVVYLKRSREKTLTNFTAIGRKFGLVRNLSTSKDTSKTLLTVLVLLLLFTALARPQYGHEWVDVQRKGIDILIALDTSKSMDVQDIRPSRLERSKLAILDFLERLEGDRIGLMTFAGSAYVICPLTIDYDAFSRTLQVVDTEIVPNQGTNISSAIQYAETVLDNNANHKLMIIITDGENLQGDVHKAATEAALHGMKIFTVGVGTESGELIPAGTQDNQFLRDDSGRWITSRLDTKNLRAIADVAEGAYEPMGKGGEGLLAIYNHKLKMIPKVDLSEKRTTIPLERFQWPLGAALLLLIVEFVLSRRKNPAQPKLWQRLGIKLLFLFALPSIFFVNTPGADAASPGEEAYLSGDYEKSSLLFKKALEKDPENGLLLFNYGTSAYKNGSYDKASSLFGKSLSTTDLKLQEKAYFNRGNALYRQGENMVQGQPEKAQQYWQNSLESFSGCLKLAPNNENAKTNYDLVKHKLEELEKQLNNQKNKSKNDEDSSKKDNDSESKPPDQQQKDQDSNQMNKSPDNKSQQNEETNTNSMDEEGREQKDDTQKEIPSPTEEQPSDGEKNEPQPATQGSTPANHESLDGDALSLEEALQLLNEMDNKEEQLYIAPQSSQTPPSPGGKNW